MLLIPFIILLSLGSSVFATSHDLLCRRLVMFVKLFISTSHISKLKNAKILKNTLVMCNLNYEKIKSKKSTIFSPVCGGAKNWVKIIWEMAKIQNQTTRLLSMFKHKRRQFPFYALFVYGWESPPSSLAESALQPTKQSSFWDDIMLTILVQKCQKKPWKLW